MDCKPWTIENDRQLDLIGNTHPPTPPTGSPRACVILLHGFLGYKDYGFIPVLAERLAQAGILVHRFNFSCSGMTNQIETFERTDLFELDTWNRQVEDVRRVCRAVRDGELPGAGGGVPLFLVGHSRGGDTAILTAGRPPTGETDALNLSGVVTINAPADCCRMNDEVRAQLLDDGFLEVKSGRTGQTLRVGRAWLSEQLEDPEAYNLESLAGEIPCPVVVVQGDADDTVPIADAKCLARACGGDPVFLAGGTHVLNVSNPADREQLGTVFEGACGSILDHILAHER